MFTEIAHLPKLLSISSSIVEIFLSIKNGKNFAQPSQQNFNFSQHHRLTNTLPLLLCPSARFLKIPCPKFVHLNGYGFSVAKKYTSK